MGSKHRPLSNVIIYGYILIICLVCLIPILTVFSISFSNEMALVKEGYSILPRQFTLEAYRFVFKDPTPILRSYGVSISVTAVGCALGLIINSMIAYALSRRDYAFRKPLTIFLAIPMVLNGGIIPTYILITSLGLKDNFWVMVLPLLVVPWFVILLRTFFSQLPPSLVEAAKVDGAGELRIYAQIVVPLSKPVMATVGMFLTLNYWNDWFLPLMYIQKNTLYNLQYKLYTIMIDYQEMVRNMSLSGMGLSLADIPTESMRMAMCVIAAGPMLLVFPFFQKYFVKGLTVGGIKA